MACSIISGATTTDKYDEQVQDYSTVHGCYMPVLDPSREVPLLTAHIKGATADEIVYDPRVHVNFFKAQPVFACTDFHYISNDYFLRLIAQPVGIANKTRFYLMLPGKTVDTTIWLWCSLESTSVQGDPDQAVRPNQWQVRVLGREMHVIGWKQWMQKVGAKNSFSTICSTNNPGAQTADTGLSVCMKTKMNDLAKTASLGTLVVVWPYDTKWPGDLQRQRDARRERTMAAENKRSRV